MSVRSKLSLFLLLLLCHTALAETSVWRVSNGANTVYFGGTVHMLRAADYPLPVAYDQAYAAADNLYFEIDLDEMNDPAAQLGLLQELMYTDGQNLQSVLSTEAYSALNSYASNLGIPMLLLQNMKPGMLTSTLEIMAYQKMGFTPEGVDVHFHQKAKQDGKAIAGLESMQQQIAFLANLGIGEESRFVLLSLNELETIADDIETTLQPWRAGDASQLDELFVNKMQRETPEAYELLVAERNRAWLPEIETMLGDADTEYVLVGVAHLVGEGGLLAMLRDRGYTVTQL